MSTRYDASLMPFGPSQDAENDDLSPEVLRCGLQLYRRAWDAYEEAGCPYGQTDEAMLVWYSFNESSLPDTQPVGKN